MFVPLYDENPLKNIRFQYVTVALIAINIIVYLASNLADERVAMSFALYPFELFKQGLTGRPLTPPSDGLSIREGYTLFTYMFMHGNLLHIVGNMLFLWVFGDNVEDAVGHLRYLFFYIACGLFAGVVHSWMNPQSMTPLIGASGAVAGVVAAYLLLYPRIHVWVLFLRIVPLHLTAAVALGGWVLMQVVMAFLPQTGPVAWWAHVGGICMGAALILVLRLPGVGLFQKATEPPLPKPDPPRPAGTS